MSPPRPIQQYNLYADLNWQDGPSKCTYRVKKEEIFNLLFFKSSNEPLGPLIPWIMRKT
jgi:hypothetical protein